MNFSVNDLKRTWKLIAILLIIILVISGEIYFFQKIIKSKNKQPTPVSEIQSTQPEQPITQPAQPIQPANEALADCGSVGPSNPNDAGKVKECFDAKFKDCKPAKMLISFDMGPLGGSITYYYEIVEPNNNFCAVKSKFLKNPNPDWIEKEMICNYDNATPPDFFNLDIKDFIGKCSGPLYNLMTQGMQLHSNPNCTLKTELTEIGLNKGVNISMTASGFKGAESQVSWKIVDKNIATVSSPSGRQIMVNSVNMGSTQLIVTDTTVGSDCFVSVPVTVKPTIIK